MIRMRALMATSRVAVFCGPTCASLVPHLRFGQYGTSERAIRVVIATENAPRIRAQAEEAMVPYIVLSSNLPKLHRAIAGIIRYYGVDLVRVDPSYPHPLDRQIRSVIGSMLFGLREPEAAAG